MYPCKSVHWKRAVIWLFVMVYCGIGGAAVMKRVVKTCANSRLSKKIHLCSSTSLAEHQVYTPLASFINYVYQSKRLFYNHLVKICDERHVYKLIIHEESIVNIGFNISRA